MKPALPISCLVLLLATQHRLPASGVNHSWEELRQTAKVGKTLDVALMNSSHFYGKLERITDDSIVLKDNRSSHTIMRSDVFRVRYLVRRGRRALWGTAIVGTIGALAWAGAEDRFKAEAATFGAIFGGAAGAVGGAALPLGPPLFQSETLPPPHR